MKQLIANQVAIMKALQLLLSRGPFSAGSLVDTTLDELTNRILESEGEA